MNTSGNIYKKEQLLLNHLTPISNSELLKYGPDCYYLHHSKFVSNEYPYSLLDRTRAWVEMYGGRFEIKSDIKFPIYRNDKKGFIVKIVFPMTGKRTRNRNMKEIMSTLY